MKTILIVNLSKKRAKFIFKKKQRVETKKMMMMIGTKKWKNQLRKKY